MRFITLSLFATLLSAPAFAADLGTYRPGTPYSSTVADGADVCENQCAGDAQCRGWNYVKPNARAAGVCEFLSSVSTPISSQISISGESGSAVPYSSRLTAGGTNTIRVGTQPTPQTSTVRVGQTASTRRIVREAPTVRATPQTASTRPVQDMSLTAQQNRYRQGQQIAPQIAPQLQVRPVAPVQRPVFRPILDNAQPQNFGQQFSQPQTQPQAQPAQQNQLARRVTGPRRVIDQTAPQIQNQQIQDPRLQDPRFQNQQMTQQQFQAQQAQQAQAQQAELQRGQSRPPIGQPIAAPQAAVQPQAVPPQASTPGQRLAQLAAQTSGQGSSVPPTGPIALSPDQARASLFGSLNDDVMPTASSVPTQPVAELPLGEVLAGGLR